MRAGKKKNMENSFMTHQGDREYYSVVHAKTVLIGFFLQQRGNKRSPVYLCRENVCDGHNFSQAQ